jgi:hypothetical protein
MSIVHLLPYSTFTFAQCVVQNYTVVLSVVYNVHYIISTFIFNTVHSI